MASLRKAKCYRTVKRAYTRKSKYKKKGYIKAVPTIKVVKFDIGNLKKKFRNEISLYSKEKIQVRENALESARLIINRKLNKVLGASNFHLKVRLYPHHALRENKMLTGAGADRMQTGMQRAFGKVIGSAAQVKKNQRIFSIYVNNKDVVAARAALKGAVHRLPCKCGIVDSKV